MSSKWVSEQFLNGTSAHNRPFQCHKCHLRSLLLGAGWGIFSPWLIYEAVCSLSFFSFLCLFCCILCLMYFMLLLTWFGEIKIIEYKAVWYRQRGHVLRRYSGHVTRRSRSRNKVPAGDVEMFSRYNGNCGRQNDALSGLQPCLMQWLHDICPPPPPSSRILPWSLPFWFLHLSTHW